MSLVTLQKYLSDARKRSQSPSPDSECKSVELPSRMMTAIRRSVLAGEAFADLSQETEELRNSLVVEADTVSTVLADRVDGILRTYQIRLQQADRDRANDFKNFCDILNEAFGHLTEGSEKSTARLKQLETGLNRATQTNDLATLRMQLGKMLDYVRQEAARDQTDSQAAIENLSHQMREAHKAKSRFRVQLPGRPEALEKLTLELADANNAGKLYLALFAADSIHAIRKRHGDEIAGNILDELSRNEIQTLSAEGEAYWWGPTSILLLWRHEDAGTPPGDLPSKLKNPFEYRAFVGTRVAVFNVAIRSLVMQARGSVEEITSELDRFMRNGAVC